eukprot:scpid95765/ scgid18661/ H/ACA ribonucleoprotein complex subunit 3; Nucleolar protein 10; Nucleolar protein family A member 3; snoRNP protein NOP10
MKTNIVITCAPRVWPSSDPFALRTVCWMFKAGSELCRSSFLKGTVPTWKFSAPKGKPATMHLMYYMDDAGKRIYTLKKSGPDGKPTKSAHPARFSPDDKFSRHRVTLKKRFGLLLTQQPKPIY